MKKLISFMLSAIMLATIILCLPASSFAEEFTIIEKTQLGSTSTYYEYDSITKTLTISGEGLTPNFSNNGLDQPWLDLRGSAIDNVVIEDGITSLGNYLLYQVRATSITLPSTLTKIGDYSCNNTSSITKWDIPFGVTSIGKSSFANNLSATEINLPDTLKTISSNAFEACASLTEITIPYSVTNIGSNCFKNCNSLQNVKFADMTSCVSISSYSFLGCTNLLELAVPCNSSIGTKAFGYKTSSAKYPNSKMLVYNESNAYTYALAQSISYAIYNSFDIDCAIGYSNKYTDSNINASYEYHFTPKTTESFCIYTRGDCDVDAELSLNGKVIATATDISQQDLNFCFIENLSANNEYVITIKSIKSTGNYTLWIYPQEINNLNVISESVTANAERNMKTIDDDLLSNVIISIEFADGICDKVYYKNDFFAGTYMKQREAELTCGNTNGYIEIGNACVSYPLFINHAYESTEVKYTVDTPSYTNYSCVLCNDSYKENITPSPAIKVVGKVVFAENSKGTHPSNKQYNYISKIVLDDTKSFNDRTYYIDENGNFTLNTFNSFDVEFYNENGKNYQFSFIVTDDMQPYSVIDYGEIAINPYDFNEDNRTNAKDYAIYLREKKHTLQNDYMEFFANFLK